MKSIASFFDRRAVPKRMLGDRSSATIRFSSRSASVSRMNGAFSRAVTFQSMRRTSSPGRYGRCSSKSKPLPATRLVYAPTRRLRIRFAVYISM